MPRLVIRFKDPSNFARLIAEKGYTQSSLSQAIGMERSYVHVVTKRNSISAPGAKKLCDALGLNFHDIFLIETSTKVNTKEVSA